MVQNWSSENFVWLSSVDHPVAAPSQLGIFNPLSKMQPANLGLPEKLSLKCVCVCAHMRVYMLDCAVAIKMISFC